MSHRNVELLLGRLVTDEQFRNEFCRNPETTLLALSERGMELSPVEVAALAATDPDALRHIAGALDPRLRKLSFAEDSSSAFAVCRPAERE